MLIPMLLTGCATGAARTDRISFDRGAFALAYGDFSAALRMKCEKKPLTPECVKFATLDSQVRTAITTPPPPEAASNPLDQLMPLIMQLLPLAAMAM